MIYKASRLIAETFDRKGIVYDLRELNELSFIEAGFTVEGGSMLLLRFLSESENNDVAIRLFRIFHRIPAERLAAAAEACMELNEKIRFFKFCLDQEGSLHMEADLPLETADDCLGLCCYELFVRAMQILNAEYATLARAVYGESRPQKPDPRELLGALRALREHPIPLNGEAGA